MNPEAAAPLADAHQRVDELGQFRGQGGELVHDHHQPGQRVLAVRAGRRLSPVRGQVLGARLAQPFLPVAQFGFQAAQGPLGQPVVEVGDQAGHMGQVGAAVEGGPTLVINQHEGQVVGVGRQGQAGHQRPQQFRLPRPGGAPDQQMGPVGHQIQFQHPVGVHPDRRGQLGSAPSPGPASLHRFGRQLSAHQVHQRHRVGQVGAGGAEFGVVEAGQPGCGGRGRGRRHAPGGEGIQDGGGPRLDQPQPPGRVDDLDDGGTRGRQLVDVAGDDDGGHPVGAQQGPARRGPPHQGGRPVHHHQAEPPGASGSGLGHGSTGREVCPRNLSSAVGGDGLGRAGHGRGVGGHQRPGTASN